jgi:EthD domain
MIKVFVLYEQEPDAERYEQHAELCRRVEGGTFRHGKVFGSPTGQRYAYYAEWDFPDLDAFKAATRTEEFAATGKDAANMGIPFHVHFVEVT